MAAIDVAQRQPISSELRGYSTAFFSPPGADGFFLGAQPAFAFALVDLNLVVVPLSRHVVDVLAARTDGALD
jgi:hypothetical protein